MNIIEESTIELTDENSENNFEEGDDGIVTCEKCYNTCDADDVTYFDDTYLCQGCLDGYTFICDDCGKREWNEDGYVNDDLNICCHCYDYDYTRCTDCDRIISNDNAHYHDDYDDEDDDDYSCDDPYCYTCYSNHKTKHIKNYSYKPEPIFYGMGLFYGVELEIDGGDDNGDTALDVLNIANSLNETHLYCKHDGSLENGFEIVTHPMSLDYHTKHMPWQKIMSCCIRMGYKAHNSDTCGLHIHVGKNELGEDISIQEDVIARIVFFIEKYWDNMLKFSRRTENQINRWASRYGCKDNPKDTLKYAKDRCLGRYVCLNLQNYSTIEFRIFRGTLKYSTFIAALQLVDTICNTAISMSDEQFQSMSWSDFVAMIDDRNKKELINYLKDKNLYTKEEEN